MRLKYALAFFVSGLFSLNASADFCPKEGEPIVTMPYQMSMVCQAATVLVHGERNPEEYESCLGDTPFAMEQVFYVSKDMKRLPLPTVNSLLSAKDSFKARLWFVGDSDPTSVKCQGSNSISVTFWSGGNCTKCTRTVEYVFTSDGRLQSATLK